MSQIPFLDTLVTATRWAFSSAGNFIFVLHGWFGTSGAIRDLLSQQPRFGSIVTSHSTETILAI